MILVAVAASLVVLSCATQAGPSPPHGARENHDRDQQSQPYGLGRLEQWQHTTLVKLKHHVGAKHAPAVCLCKQEACMCSLSQGTARGNHMASRCRGCHVAIRISTAPVVAYPCIAQRSYAPICAVSQSVSGISTSAAIVAVFADDFLSDAYLFPAGSMS